jgi:predicted metal-dependent hydrolase
MSDFPPYTVRVSPRAKNIRLQVTWRDGLQVIVPRGYDPTRIPALLEKKRAWVRAALERAANHRKYFEPEPLWKPPTSIRLAAIGYTWQLDAKSTDFSGVTLRSRGPGQLQMLGNIENEAACHAAMRRWLSRQAHEHLLPWLEQTSLETGLHNKQVLVKQQRTRWASCSRHQNISLNAKLLFLERDLVQYVFIHELCHLQEMNHSSQFWRLVEEKCSNYKTLDSKIREAWKLIPRWAGIAPGRV